MSSETVNVKWIFAEICTENMSGVEVKFNRLERPGFSSHNVSTFQDPWGEENSYFGESATQSLFRTAADVQYRSTMSQNPLRLTSSLRHKLF